MSANAEVRTPYPGLRSFRRSETELFFGREALTTRSLLLNAVARQTRHAGQTRLRVTSSHGRREHVKAALQSIAGFFAVLKKTAEQLTDAERWACILSQALRKYLRGRKLRPPPVLQPA